MGLTCDTGGFMGAMHTAARYIGVGDGTRAALEGELGKVLQRAADYTKAPAEAEFRQRVEYGLRRKFNTYAAGDIGVTARKTTPRISNCPGTGNAWWVDYSKTGQKKFYLMNGGPRKNWGDRYNRYLAEEQERQSDLALELQQYLPKIMKARGLSKQSWWQIGQALGIEVPGIPAYVRGAVATDGQLHQNGVGTCTDKDDSLLYRLENMMPTLINPRKPEEGLMGMSILQRAFDSREKAIMIGIEKGIFDDLEKAIKRFPGLALLR